LCPQNADKRLCYNPSEFRRRRPYLVGVTVGVRVGVVRVAVVVAFPVGEAGAVVVTVADGETAVVAVAVGVRVKVAVGVALGVRVKVDV
jgi:hypothetical protein